MALQSNNNLISFLNSLLAIYPSDALLLVGAGNGSGSLVEWLIGNKISHVTLVEPLDTEFRQLQSLISNLDWIESESWILSKEVVAKESAQIDFYYANKSSESGLVDLEACKEIWPNLKLNQQVTLQAVGLDTFLSQSSEVFNWLVIDCLGALQLIGNDTNLKCVDVIVVRALFDLENNTETYSAYAEINKILNSQGFNERLQHAGQHPNVGHVVFVRDYKCQSTELVKELNIQKAAYEHTTSQLKAESQQASELQTKQNAEEINLLAAQTQQLRQQLDALSTLHEQVLSAHKTEQESWLALQQSSERKVKQDADEVNQQQLQQELDILKAVHEKTLHQHKVEQDIWLTWQQTSEAKAKQRADEVSRQQVQLLQQQLDTLKNIKTVSKDAEIDDFINDLIPFFYGRSITYVDIGACFGDVFLKIYNTKSIKMREAHLYEPNPDSFAKLSENIHGLKTPSLHAYNIGVADSEKILKMSKAGTMTKAVTHRVGVDVATEMFEVNCYALDELSNAITDRRIDLLKIDVEGSEIVVLKGAKQLLKDQRIDIIYIEVGFNINGTQQVYFGEVDALMQKFNYRCFKIYEQKNEWIQDSPLLRRCNFAYMSANFAKSNPYKISIELQNLRKQIQNKPNT